MDTIHKIVEDADKYRSEKQYELAIDKYTEAIAKLYVSRGEVFGILQQYENEVDDFTKALSLTTDDWLSDHLHRMRGMVHLIMCEYDKAILDLTISIDRTHSFISFYLRGRAFEGIGDYQRARKDYNVTLDLYPTHEPARKALEGLDMKESNV